MVVALRWCALLVWLSSASVRAAEPLVVLHVPDYPPYEYLDDDGQPQGCFIELYRLIGAKLGREVRFVALPFSQELVALREGRGDVITGMTDTPERRWHYDFAPGLFHEENHLISAVDAPQLQTLADCAGRRIGVVDGEVTIDLVAGAGGVPVVHPDYDSLFEAAITGAVDHFTTSTEVAFHLLIRRGNIGDFRLSDQPILSTEFKPAVRKGDTRTLALVERGMEAVSEAELTRIARRWLPSQRIGGGPSQWELITFWSLGVLALCIGVVGAAIGINRQLRQRVARATSELATVNRTLQEVLDAATEVAIIATDAAGVITVFNRGAERMLGYAADEMVGQRTPLDYHDLEEVRRRALEQGAVRGHPVTGLEACLATDANGGNRHWSWIRKDGERRLVHLIVTPMQGPDGGPVGHLVVATGCTRPGSTWRAAANSTPWASAPAASPTSSTTPWRRSWARPNCSRSSSRTARPSATWPRPSSSPPSAAPGSPASFWPSPAAPACAARWWSWATWWTRP